MSDGMWLGYLLFAVLFIFLGIALADNHTNMWYLLIPGVWLAPAALRVWLAVITY